MHPLGTVLDDSIGCALWFAARGEGLVKSRGAAQPILYKSQARVRVNFVARYLCINYYYILIIYNFVAKCIYTVCMKYSGLCIGNNISAAVHAVIHIISLTVACGIGHT